jgi:hypothetical protein
LDELPQALSTNIAFALMSGINKLVNLIFKELLDHTMVGCTPLLIFHFHLLKFLGLIFAGIFQVMELLLEGLKVLEGGLIIILKLGDGFIFLVNLELQLLYGLIQFRYFTWVGFSE